ncbi:cytochrome P450 [Penicillium frequentans]|nr:cytochrome P450 [Penicillium glabrum]
MAGQAILLSSWGVSDVGFPGMVTGLALVIFVALVAKLALRTYRTRLHPLSSFKGLPEACVSEHWLYKITKSGRAEQTFEALHEKYNTKAVRIGPNELHITDIELYKVIYNQSKPFLKHAPFYDGFSTPHTVFAELDPRLHKERRRMLNPLFSKVGVYKLEPLICEKIYMLSAKITRLCATKEIDIYNAVRLLTTEIITEFAFAKSPNLIEERSDEMDSWFLDAFDVGSQSIVDLQYNSVLRNIVSNLPASVVKILNPQLRSILDLQEPKSISDNAKVSEAMDILIAGADTTASTLTTGFLHILSNDMIKSRLVQAIDEAMPDTGSLISLQALEKVEYLSACVKESIRVGMAVPGRLPRVVPNGDPFVVEGKVVPPGTIVGISTYTMHNSEDAWGPDAREFNPDRWIGPGSKGLEQWMCTFSKGARMCLGQNVAPAEITLAFAYLFRNYELSLPKGHVKPDALDHFTLAYQKPGLPVVFKPRQ